jgi:hypothetical protein
MSEMTGLSSLGRSMRQSVRKREDKKGEGGAWERETPSSGRERETEALRCERCGERESPRGKGETGNKWGTVTERD